MEEYIGGESNSKRLNEILKLDKKLQLIKEDNNSKNRKIVENNNLIADYKDIDKYHKTMIKVGIFFSPLIGFALALLVETLTKTPIIVASKFALEATLFQLVSGIFTTIYQKFSCVKNKKRFKKEHFNNEYITIDEMKEKIKEKNNELSKCIEKNKYKIEVINFKLRELHTLQKENLHKESKASIDTLDDYKQNEKYIDGDNYYVKNNTGNVKKYGEKRIIRYKIKRK